jgi:hypothetical protein
MCEKCLEIDRTIERYRQVQLSISDELTIDRAKEVIVELESRKSEIHQTEAGGAGFKLCP